MKLNKQELYFLLFLTFILIFLIELVVILNDIEEPVEDCKIYQGNLIYSYIDKDTLEVTTKESNVPVYTNCENEEQERVREIN